MLPIKTADELIDAELEARWEARRADRRRDVLQHILRTFIEHGGPVPVEMVARAFPDSTPDVVWTTLATLDERDLIQVRDGRVEVAYPFSVGPTAFVARLPDGQERYACCAIDALGLAPMLGHTVHIRSWCHHCHVPLELEVGPDGPLAAADGIMVWGATREAGERRLTTSL